MLVESKVINQIKSSNNPEQISEFLQGLSDSQKGKFYNWFVETANYYTEIKSEISEFDRPKFTQGSCYSNAQSNAIKFKLDYHEGFYVTNMGSNSILHGFNMKNGMVIDFTVASNAYYESQYGELPTQYCGILIPSNFIKLQPDESYKYNRASAPNFAHLTPVLGNTDEVLANSKIC